MTTFQFASIGHSWWEWKRIASTSRPLCGDDRGQVAERGLERRRVGIRVDEDERPPRVDRDGREREARRVEARLALRAGRAPERSVEVVRPRVVRALERLATARALDDEVAAVPADVDEPAEHAVRSRARPRRERGRCARRSTSPAPPPTPPARVRPGAAKIRSRSSAWTSGSAYQLAGSVQPSSSGCSSAGTGRRGCRSGTCLLLTVLSVRILRMPGTEQAAALAGRRGTRRRDPARGLPCRRHRRRERPAHRHASRRRRASRARSSTTTSRPGRSSCAPRSRTRRTCASRRSTPSSRRSRPVPSAPSARLLRTIEPELEETPALWNEVWSSLRYDEELRPLVQERYRAWIERIVRLLDEGRDDGSVPASVDPAGAGWRLAAAADGLDSILYLGLLDRDERARAPGVVRAPGARGVTRRSARSRSSSSGSASRFDDVAAVDDVSLEIGSGEFFSLLGPSGCGKTTTLRMIAGFERPDAGRILIGDADVTEMPPHLRPVNTVFQSYALFPHLSVEQNVGFGLRFKDVSKDERRARVAEALELVRLGGLGAAPAAPALGRAAAARRARAGARALAVGAPARRAARCARREAPPRAAGRAEDASSARSGSRSSTSRTTRRRR